MKHKPQTEEEIAKSGLMEPGVYDFKIIEAIDKPSKSGNDMFKLKLHVYDSTGEERIIFDWVLPDFPKKYKHLHDACGLLDLYLSGETTESDLVGKTGKLLLGIGKPYTDNNGIERTNNSVVDYVKKNNLQAYETSKLPKDVGEGLLSGDEIPF